MCHNQMDPTLFPSVCLYIQPESLCGLNLDEPPHSHHTVYPSGSSCSSGSQQLLLPGSVQCRREELRGGAAAGCAAAELPADSGLLLHGAPQHEHRRPVSADVHRRLPPDPTDNGERHRVFPQGDFRVNE